MIGIWSSGCGTVASDIKDQQLESRDWQRTFVHCKFFYDKSSFDSELGLVLMTKLKQTVSPTSCCDLVSAYPIKPILRTWTLSHRKYF